MLQSHVHFVAPENYSKYNVIALVVVQCHISHNKQWDPHWDNYWIYEE